MSPRSLRAHAHRWIEAKAHPLFPIGHTAELTLSLAAICSARDFAMVWTRLSSEPKVRRARQIAPTFEPSPSPPVSCFAQSPKSTGQAWRAVFVGGLEAAVVCAAHDGGEPVLRVVECPGAARGVLLRLQSALNLPDR